MSRDLRIDVNVNPNGVASPTQTKTTETPVANQIQNRTAKNYVEAAAILSIIQRSIGRASSNIGELTGNSTAARKTASAGRIVALTYAASINPGAALLTLGTQIATQAVQRSIENRNVANEAEYNRILRTATYNSGRK
jgi:hypothetical protein